MNRIVINGAFRGQRVTGQQRYAHEVAAALSRVAGAGSVREIAPGEAGHSRWGAWAFAQGMALGLALDETLLSLTSRAPLLGSARHAVAIHDLFVLDNPEWYTTRYHRTHAPILRHHLTHAKHLFAVSRTVAAAVAARFDRTCVVAPNAPAEVFLRDRPDAAGRSVLEAYSLSPGRYILAVASRDRRKNIDALIAAYASLPASFRSTYPLVLVGGGSDVSRAPADAGADDDATRVGYIEDDHLAVLYRAAAAVAFPSLAEGFGLPAVEALASGARLVVSDIPVFHEVCGDAASYVNPTSVADIAAALQRTVESRWTSDDRDRISDDVRRRYSWESTARTIASTLAAS